jgi:hypothetical protein
MSITLLFIVFMAILLIVMTVVLVVLLRPRRRQHGFPVIPLPSEKPLPPAPTDAPKP